MKVLVLAGGFGSRLQEETDRIPKPMVEIGGRPILWHILNIYGFHGFKEFVVALGYKGDVIKNYFLNYYHLRSNMTVHFADGNVDVHVSEREDWVVHLVDTGIHTQTGGRIKRLCSLLGNETFMMSYGDGVSNVNIRELLAFHEKHGKLATITAVRPPARFGSLKIEEGLVTRFAEKPHAGEGWINGGFFVLEPGVLDFIDGDATVFEKGPLERLAQEGQLVAFQHQGFWQCMDTLRDLEVLQSLWQREEAPWKVWAR